MAGKPAPVVIVDYDARWPDEFESLAAAYDGVLSKVQHRIEHMGSTSIPLCAAKSIIDIIIVIPSTEDFPATRDALARLGYAHVGDQEVPGREVFKRDAGGELARLLDGEPMRHHLYVCPEGGENLEKMLFFRDYLRTHPATRDRYAALKKELAVKYRNDRVGYTDAKTEFVESVLEAMDSSTHRR